MKIAINGLGRIGRKLTKIILEKDGFELIAINDIMPIEKAVHFLKYDSTYGMSNLKIEESQESILIEGKEIKYSSEKSIKDLDWNHLHLNIAIHCSGTNKSCPDLKRYLDLGVEKVILSAPPDDDEIPIIINGFNHEEYRSKPIISNASCTTYCVAPILELVERNYGIHYANFTTIHCYTSDQNLQDAFHPDFRRARAAGVNIIPTTTSATKVIKKIFPNLKDKVTGSSFRVPVINGSITEFIIDLKKTVTVKEVISQIQTEAKEKYQDIIALTEDQIVSTDVINSPYAALIDTHSIEVCQNKLKLTAFYDNEAGYSNQLIKLIESNISA